MQRSKLAFIIGAIWCVGALPACGSKGGTSDDYLAGAPEVSALQLSVTDDASSEGLATDADAVDPTSEVAQGLGEAASGLSVQVAPELANAREAVADLNQALKNFMQPIVALVRDTDPTTTDGNVKTWGPVTRGATEFRFVMRRGVLRTRFGWLLQARVAGSNDDFSTVAAGAITVGYAARRGVGTVGIDLDALGAIDPTIVARGALLAGFAHGPNGSALAYRLKDFSPNPQTNAPISAILQGVHLKEGFNRLRLAYHGNVAGTATSAKELVLARVRHLNGEGGRADVLVTGGDVANGHAWLVSECWNAQLQAAYRVVRDCPADGIGGDQCVAVSSAGDPAACGHDVAAAEFPPADPMAAMSDPESPVGDVTPPAGMPDGNPPDSN
jgi:hypothetical protein